MKVRTKDQLKQLKKKELVELILKMQDVAMDARRLVESTVIALAIIKAHKERKCH